METIAQTGDVEVRRATIEDLDTLVPLFDAYRQFYRQPSAPTEARRFLRDRLEQNESIVFLALVEAAAVGFTQLYPSFSSAPWRAFSFSTICLSHPKRAGAVRL